MGGFFDNISGIALDRLNKIHDQTVHSEFITGKAAWQSRHNEFFAGLAQDEDYENIPNKYDTERQKWETEIFAGAKTRQAQEALKNLITESDPQIQKVLQEVMVAKHEKKMQGDYLTSLDSFLGAGKFGMAKAATAEAIQKGYIDNEEWLVQKIINAAPELASQFIDDAKNIDPGRKNQLRSQARTANLRKQAEGLEQLEINREKRKDYISKAIRAGKDATDAIEGKAIVDEKGMVILPDKVGMLEEDVQWTWGERQRADVKRRAEGVDIITDPKVKTELQKDIMGVLTWAMTRDEVLAKMDAARFDPENPTLNEDDYAKLETSLHAQYEQAYIRGMSQVQSYARGILLKPDTFGLIKNAPIRHRILGEFNDAWQIWIAEQGDKLKVSDIYPEGRYMASLHQISDEEAERQEDELEAIMKAREKGEVPETKGLKVGGFDQTNLTGEERAAEFEKYRFDSLPRPKNKAEFDALKSGERFVDPEGVERMKP